MGEGEPSEGIESLHIRERLQSYTLACVASMVRNQAAGTHTWWASEDA
jgi:hypothetical protein